MSSDGNIVFVKKKGFKVSATEEDITVEVPVTNTSDTSSYEVKVNWSAAAGPNEVGLGNEKMNVGPGNTRVMEITFTHDLSGGAVANVCANAEIVGGGGGGL